MPRANRSFVEGHLAHVTHRCHDSDFLFKNRNTRREYKARLRFLLKKFRTKLLGYNITSNHVHLLFLPHSKVDLAFLMQRVQGEFAEWFNQKHARSGAFWSDRYHATMIQNDRHLWQCLRYIDLNMVRAGVVEHPSEWEWCGYGELVGKIRRYRLIDVDWWLDWSGEKDLPSFQKTYTEWVHELASKGDANRREPWWTESIAVGDKGFVSQFESLLANRVDFKVAEAAEGIWMIREEKFPYSTQNGGFGVL